LPGAQHESDPLAWFVQLDRFQHALADSLLNAYDQPGQAKLLALKACNLLAADYHYRHGHASLCSRPVQLMIDPANACQLRCPGCVHSENRSWADRFDWPSGVISDHHLALIEADLAPYACAAVLYNYGEPLLYKGLAKLVERLKCHGLFVMTSTNLALRADLEALLRSGLDRLVISVDGASQASYGRFRRRGEFATVVENMQRIANIRSVDRSSTTYVVWQYLVFEHNAHELERALELARQFDIDEVRFNIPFDVSVDDPSLRPGRPELAAVHVLTDRAAREPSSALRGMPAQSLASVEQAFGESWSARARLLEGLQSTPAGERRCGWLYHNLTLDAVGRAMPCCMAPARNEKHLVYGKLGQGADRLLNSPDAMLSRHERNRHDFDPTLRPAGWNDRPHCLNCDENPLPPWSFGVSEFMQASDPLGTLPVELLVRLERSELYAAARGASA
jgi:MoaA/NifB/PqqE/SkfB family radical SAM enzyme